ncbi:MAG TPA: hypothetical protein PK706_25330 [Xanthobacteraceae bacterium]|jgi:hypothetical protein|nr:hypothetical protein [Xanthobacteraceae bacterium]
MAFRIAVLSLISFALVGCNEKKEDTAKIACLAAIKAFAIEFSKDGNEIDTDIKYFEINNDRSVVFKTKMEIKNNVSYVDGSCLFSRRDLLEVKSAPRGMWSLEVLSFPRIMIEIPDPDDINKPELFNVNVYSPVSVRYMKAIAYELGKEKLYRFPASNTALVWPKD